jgi:hypothetical protein
LEIDSRGDSIQNSFLPSTIYRGFFRLYLTVDEGQVIDIKYNIGELDNEKFLIKLGKMASDRKPSR